MRTIPASMTWEILARGRWHLLFAMLGAIAIPAMMLNALRSVGPVDPLDPSMLNMHFIVTLSVMIIFGAAIFSVQEPVSRLYAYPIRTSAIVVWRLLPAMMIIAAQVIVCFAILNQLFHLQWPLWGPAMLAAIAFASAQAVVWLTEKSVVWLATAMAIVGSTLGLWFRSRYGGMFSDPQHFWQQVTSVELFTLLTVAAASCWLAVKAVARNRCGEPPLSLGWVDWLNHFFDVSPKTDRQLGTAFQAQCWHEWRRKGWAMPVAVLICLVMGLSIWLFGSRRPEDLYAGFLGGALILAMIGAVTGVLFGNTGPDDANFAMGSFLATRPMSDADMAHAILRTAFKSVFVAWLIWAVAFLIACGCLVASGANASVKLPDAVGWWYFPSSLLAPWTVTAVTASLGLLGRSKQMLQLLCVTVALFIATLLISEYLLSPHSRLLFGRAIAAVLASGLLVTGVWAFTAVRRRNLLQTSIILAAAIAWVAGTIISAILWTNNTEPRLLAYLVIAAVLSLAITPLAAAPLALIWNRHR